MSVVGRAVKDSKEMARLAVEAAKNELVEDISPTIKRLIEQRLREGTLADDVDRLRRAADGHMETEFEEGKKMEDEKVESVASLFPSVNEVSEGDDCMDESEVPTLGEGEDMEDDVQEGADAPVEETIELSEAELEAMYNEALQLEVEVKKGFSPIAEPHELGAGARNDNTGEAAALADKKHGEHDWEGEEPPAKKDWIPEGIAPQVRTLIRKGMQENKALRAKANKLEGMVKALHGKLVEMNLLNSKILHVNKFMSAHKLTNEQKKTVIESIDRGGSIAEVKNIYGVLESAFGAAGVVSEGRNKPRADAGKRRTSGAPDAKVLRESADKAEGNGQWDRIRTLAGLSKLTNG